MKILFALLSVLIISTNLNKVYCPPPLKLHRTTLVPQNQSPTIESTSQWSAPKFSPLFSNVEQTTEVVTSSNVEEAQYISDFLPEQIMSQLNPKLMSPFMVIFALIKNFIEKILLIVSRL